MSSQLRLATQDRVLTARATLSAPRPGTLHRPPPPAALPVSSQPQSSQVQPSAPPSSPPAPFTSTSQAALSLNKNVVMHDLPSANRFRDERRFPRDDDDDLVTSEDDDDVFRGRRSGPRAKDGKKERKQRGIKSLSLKAQEIIRKMTPNLRLHCFRVNPFVNWTQLWERELGHEWLSVGSRLYPEEEIMVPEPGVDDFEIICERHRSPRSQLARKIREHTLEYYSLASFNNLRQRQVYINTLLEDWRWMCHPATRRVSDKL